MGFLRGVFGRDRVPEWASFLGADEFRRFIELVEADLRGRGFGVEMGDGLVMIRTPASDEPIQAGLGNLVQLCNQIDRAEWPQAIKGHFDAVTAVGAEEPYTTDVEAARPLLKVRIYAEGDLPTNELVTSPLAPGLISVLVYDLPTTVRTVAAADAAAWPLPIDELFRIGLANTLAEEPAPERLEIPLDGGGTISALQGASFFVASRLLGLGDLVPVGAGYGALVAIPTRHMLLFHPIADAAVIRAVNTMIAAADGLYREGPGSITPQLYWWHDGALTHLPSRIEGSKMQFFPPDAFVQVLNQVVGS